MQNLEILRLKKFYFLEPQREGVKDTRKKKKTRMLEEVKYFLFNTF